VLALANSRSKLCFVYTIRSYNAVVLNGQGAIIEYINPKLRVDISLERAGDMYILVKWDG
jgi:hypothetical protein